VKLFKDIVLPSVLGMGLALSIYVAVEYFKPTVVVEPIVCMQDAPIVYDWQGELITGYWYDGVSKAKE
tara:strand:- start:50 stop:253 length:204 start_codon:yes stop_codon:yes gene_type:complete